MFGVVYEIDDQKMSVLDRFEGEGHGYKRIDVLVELHAAPTPAVTYRATLIEQGILPYDWYHDLVLAGARQHNLPTTYVRTLEMQPVQCDQDEVRAASERAQLALRPQGV
jgi:hypothetical protein